MDSFYSTNLNAKDFVSYSTFINTALDKLGFKATFKGTIYLKQLILFAYSNNYNNIYIEQIVSSYISTNNLKITKRAFISNIEYAIYNTNSNKFKNNFYNIFHVDYDIYYKSTRNIVILFLNLLS